MSVIQVAIETEGFEGDRYDFVLGGRGKRLRITVGDGNIRVFEDGGVCLPVCTLDELIDALLLYKEQSECK